MACALTSALITGERRKRSKSTLSPASLAMETRPASTASRLFSPCGEIEERRRIGPRDLHKH